MPSVIADVKVERDPPPKPEEHVTEIRANFISLGGGVVLAITIVATLFLVFSLLIPMVGTLQLAIIAILALACWVYTINRFSERFRLVDGTLEFNVALGRSQKFQLEQVTALRLTDFGWSLNGDFYVFEISVAERSQPIQIGLGPCWRRQDLTAFIDTVGRFLEKTNQEN
ncbi:MAG: hypothetical protein PHC53_02040 [Patescibacteria group bacterium]|nr:hypothetical protein [Patescibacteria group bacterium]